MTVTKSRSEEILMEQLNKYYSLITDTWKYIKCFTENLPHTEAEWMNAIDAGNRLIEKHGDTEFARQIVMASIEEVDRIAKFRRIL